MTTTALPTSTSSRRVRLRLQGCAQPPLATPVKTKLEIEIDLKRAFHHGYIDLHGKAPATGTNPLFDEYVNLLADSPYLIWSPPGIAADDDARSGESHRLGRAISRAYLEQHCGFTWFAPVSELTRRPMEGWSARQKAKGDMPDWLTSDGSITAVAEAKGRSHSINSELKKWRQQVQNIDVLKDGHAVSLPTYIVANRWANSNQPRVRPEIYVEDPPTQGRELTDNDSPGLGLWTMRVHTAQNLVRLGQRALAERMLSQRRVDDRESIRVLTWRCLLPGLDHLRFIGRRVAPQSGLQCHELLAVMASAFFEERPFWRRPDRRLWVWLASAIEEWRQQSYFDGVLVDSVKAGLYGSGTRERFSDVRELPQDVSLLGDGSLIAPASLVDAYDVVTL